eukprot:TRINITY_DN9187_c0_g1_i1.p1 TRINITY_DN9187_c0_g1~~TRINITY_DN9187_c0_g1_i1.p1  ORF type:complete len:229 (-),score=41.11 TRINITY_DN9187_c0_g1_i1:402-1088(-)
MLLSKYPTQEGVGKYLNNFSEHKRFLSYSVGRGPRFTRPVNALNPGPGHYKVDRDYPEHEEHDMGTTYFTRVAPKFSIPTESRTAPDGTMKGMSLSPNKEIPDSLGPGQYPMYRLGVKSEQKEFVTLTFPKSLETQEALRDRKKKSNVPGPGVYSLKRYGDDLGQEKTRIIERNIKKGTRCWAQQQYSHIYQCMKPRSNSMPQLPPAQVAAAPQSTTAQEQPAAAAPS